MKGYRTIVFNSIMAALMLASTFGVIAPSESPDASTINTVLDNVEALIGTVTILVNFVLRFMTSTKVGAKS